MWKYSGWSNVSCKGRVRFPRFLIRRSSMWSSLVHLSFPRTSVFFKTFYLTSGSRNSRRFSSIQPRREVGKGWWKVVVRIGGGFSGVASPRGECEWMAGVGHDTERAEDPEPSSLGTQTVTLLICKSYHRRFIRGSFYSC